MNIKKLMQEKDITAYRLAKLSGVSQATISRMKKNSNYTRESFDKVMNTLENYNKKGVVCERCEKDVDEVYACERCDRMICDGCQAQYNQFTQIDYNCCKSCANH